MTMTAISTPTPPSNIGSEKSEILCVGSGYSSGDSGTNTTSIEDSAEPCLVRTGRKMHSFFEGTIFPKAIAGESLICSGRVIKPFSPFDPTVSARDFPRELRMTNFSAPLHESPSHHQCPDQESEDCLFFDLGYCRCNNWIRCQIGPPYWHPP